MTATGDDAPPAETRTAAPFLDGLFFGEAPRWHDGRLWWSDFFDRAVHSVADVDGLPRDRRLEAAVSNQPSGLGWLPDGRLLVVSMLDRVVLRREPDGTLVRHGGLEPWATYHANDMLVDPTGRAYVGNFGFDLGAFFEGRAELVPASLVRIDPDGTASEAASGLSFPNGMALLPGGRMMVVAESMANRLTAFEVSTDGTLDRRREWATLGTCSPDGICADAEGAVWVANATAAECLRVAEGGEVLERVVTAQRCYACALGGDDGRTLYCMTAPSARSATERMTPRAAIERVRVTVPGAGSP